MERVFWHANVCVLDSFVSGLWLMDNHTVGSLLDVPTHTVNMTTLRTTQELWSSYSMSPFEEAASTSTLAEFLIDNEGKRCVVVLDVRSPLVSFSFEIILTLIFFI